MPDQYRYKIGNRLYGCDTCQQVCPKIEVLIPNKMTSFWNQNFKAKISTLLRMSNKEFKQTYGHLQVLGVVKKPIQRNAILALAHFNEVDAIPE